jgi:hypothetical protein
MKLLIALVFLVTFAILCYVNLRYLKTASTTTALDKGNHTDRITGRIERHGYGWPFVFLETATYQEAITGQPPEEDIGMVRDAGRDMMQGFDDAGRLWYPLHLLANLLIYVAISGGAALLVTGLWRIFNS